MYLFMVKSSKISNKRPSKYQIIWFRLESKEIMSILININCVFLTISICGFSQAAVLLLLQQITTFLYQNWVKWGMNPEILISSFLHFL